MPRHLNPADAAANNEYMAMVLLVDDQAIIGEAIRRALANEADIDFHTALLVASHNIIFIQLAGVVRSAMRSLFDTTETVGSNPPEALALHLAVVEAVRLRRPEDAVKAMSQILDMAERDLRHAGMDSFL